MGKTKKAIQSRGLSPDEKREKISLTQGFSDYWNHLKFDLESTKEGTIKRLLDEAAEATILIKAYLVKQNPSLQIRLNPGGVREYLHNLEAFPSSERDFVAGVVKSTFAYSDGFIGNLTEEDIEKYLNLITKSRVTKNLESSEDIRELEKQTKEAFEDANKLAQEIFATIEENLNTNPAYYKELVKMNNGIHNLKNLVTKFHEALKNRIKDHSDASSDISYEADSDEQNVNVMETDETASKSIEIKVTNEELKPPTNPENPEQKEEGKEQPNPSAAEGENSNNTTTSTEPEALVISKNVFMVNKVASEVGQIQEGIQSLSNDVKILDLQQLVNNPSEGKKLVDKLHQRCIGFSESLMKDLTTLDELTLRQEDRPKRKEQVQKIQSMVNDVDNLLGKLHELVELVKKEEAKQQQIEEEKKKVELEKQKEKQEKEKQEKEQEIEEDDDPSRTLEDILSNILQQQQKKTRNELDLQGKKEEFQKQLVKQAQRLEPYWRKMKLNPRMDVEEELDRYVVSTYIPGMNQEDIQIATTMERGSPILTIKGHRSPTFEELTVMRRQLARSGIEPSDETILKLGAGRFGTFLEKFALPKNVEVDEIRCNYEGGELIVVLPKIRIRQFPRQTNQSIPIGGGSGRYPLRGFDSPFMPSNDYWW